MTQNRAGKARGEKLFAQKKMARFLLYIWARKDALTTCIRNQENKLDFAKELNRINKKEM